MRGSFFGMPIVSVLTIPALSDGAFVAGLLNRCGEFGDRPKLKMVFGAAGSLIAPFAFLGAEYRA